MAKIKMGHIVAEIRGKIGGTVFSRNTYGAYIRAKVTPTNPGTVDQQTVRQFMASIAQAWRGLTAAQRLGFNLAAETWTNTNIFGDSQALTGFNLFMKLNRNRLEINEVQITAAPTPAAVTGFSALAIVSDEGTPDKLELTFAPAIGATQKVIVYATAQLSAGIDFVKSEYRKIDVLTTADASPFNVGAEYKVKFGALPTVGSKVFIKLVPVVILTGQAGAAITASTISLDTP